MSLRTKTKLQPSNQQTEDSMTSFFFKTQIQLPENPTESKLKWAVHSFTKRFNADQLCLLSVCCEAFYSVRKPIQSH